MPTRTEEKIQVCGHCGGKGYTLHEELVNYHKREYDTIYSTCPSCEGTGLQILITTVSTTLKPHKPRIANDGNLV